MKFNERIKELRLEQPDSSQKKLGEQVGCGGTTISSYETGRTRPTFEVLCKISETLNVSTDYLLGRTDVRDMPIFTPEHKALFEIFNELNKNNQDTVLSQAKFLHFQQNPQPSPPETPKVDFVDPFKTDPAPRKPTQFRIAQERIKFFDDSDDD